MYKDVNNNTQNVKLIDCLRRLWGVCTERSLENMMEIFLTFI